MENIFNIDKLPNDVLLYLASFLYIEDIICLSMTCKYLRSILPLRLIRGPSIAEYGPDTWESWQPSIYFDTPPLTSYIFTAAVSGTSILPTVVAGAGGLGLLGIGRIQMQLVKDGLIRT